MTTYFVAASGSNTAPYDTWAKAATSLQTALTAANADGDVVAIQYDGVPAADKENAGTTTYTVNSIANLAIIASTNSGTATVTPTAMGTSNWIGNSTTSNSVYISNQSPQKQYWFGLTFRTGGAAPATIYVNVANRGCQVRADQCYFYLGTSHTNCLLEVGNTYESYTEFNDCTIRFSNALHGLKWISRIVAKNLTLAGTAPTVLFKGDLVSYRWVDISASDLSLVTGSLCGAVNSSSGKLYRLTTSRLGAGVTVMDAQTVVPHLGAGEITLVNCDSGATNYRHEKWNALGSQVIETSIVRTGGATDGVTPVSWKLVTTANSTWAHPFESLPLSVWNESTASVTATIYGYWDSASLPKNDDIFAELSYMASSGSPIATIVSTTKADYLAANADCGSDSSAWGGGDTTTRFKMTLTFTPAMKGYINGVVKAAKASSTFYIDPKMYLS